MISRRDWVGRTALAAAAFGLPRPLRPPPLRRAAERPYLALALECARWISASERRDGPAAVWPADPTRPESVGIDFYNGMPGVVVFLGELFRATGDSRWREAALAGSEHLAAEMERRGPEQLDAGLYTGLGGLAFTFMTLESLPDGARQAARARRAIELLRARARPAEGGLDWNGSYDIISGAAGIGLLLLEAHRRHGDPASLELAREAGGRLLAVAEPARGGLMWYPGARLRRNYPNFSHGTAGVAYFLATLFERTGERRFLDAAHAGAHYLDAIAVRNDGATLIHHHDGGGEDLFYLSWCHGPPGTARLFHRLHHISGEARWMDWVVSLTRATLAAGIPEQRTPGFWNNISQCCGNVGVGDYFLDVSRGAAAEPGAGMVRRVLDDTLARADRDQRGLRWAQAEHRVRPEEVVAQTGFMQGAAGVGTFLLKLDAFAERRPWSLWLPDSPFGEPGRPG